MTERDRLIELIMQKSCIGRTCIDDCLECNRIAITHADAEFIADCLTDYIMGLKEEYGRKEGESDGQYEHTT